MKFEPRSALAEIQPYVPGKSASDLGGAREVIKLSSNENPLGPSPRVAEVVAREVANAHLYPEGSGKGLRSELGRRLGVGPENIVLGCGSDEVIRLLAEAYLDPGDGCLFADSTFSQYPFVARIMGAREIIVPLKDGVHDLEAMAETARRERPKICFVCNPNNPTGTYVSRSDVERFLERVPPETMVVFDEAYIEYADAEDFPDAVEYMRAGRDVVSLRTFSKIYGLAGIRVGYGVAPAEVVQSLQRIRPPFNVNRLAQVAALAALDDAEHVEKSRSMNTHERRRVAHALEEMGLRVLPSQSNFLFVETDVDGTLVYEALAQEGVIIRQGAPFARPMAFRVTVGTPSQNDRFLNALERVLPGIRERGSKAL